MFTIDISINRTHIRRITAERITTTNGPLANYVVSSTTDKGTITRELNAVDTSLSDVDFARKLLEIV